MNKRVFISFSDKYYRVCNKIESFLIELKLKPIIAKREPNRGNGLDRKIERVMKKCFSAVIICTPDLSRIEGQKSNLQPASNVSHEVGLAQGFYKNKIIYLKEKNCTLPSNFAPKGYYPFEILDETGDRVLLDEALTGIIKELKAFGALKIKR
jgi:predicted nucleotide-binding protein